MKKLDVYYCGWGECWRLGTLADNGTSLLFEYSPEALAQQLELSPRHLKLRSQAYGGFPAYQHRLPGLVADAAGGSERPRLLDSEPCNETPYCRRGVGSHAACIRQPYIAVQAHCRAAKLHIAGGIRTLFTQQACSETPYRQATLNSVFGPLGMRV